MSAWWESDFLCLTASSGCLPQCYTKTLPPRAVFSCCVAADNPQMVCRYTVANSHDDIPLKQSRQLRIVHPVKSSYQKRLKRKHSKCKISKMTSYSGKSPEEVVLGLKSSQLKLYTHVLRVIIGAFFRGRISLFGRYKVELDKGIFSKLTGTCSGFLVC